MVLYPEIRRHFEFRTGCVGADPFHLVADAVHTKYANRLAVAVVTDQIPVSFGESDSVRLDQPVSNLVVADGVVIEPHGTPAEHGPGQFPEVRFLLAVRGSLTAMEQEPLFGGLANLAGNGQIELKLPQRGLECVGDRARSSSQGESAGGGQDGGLGW